MTELENLTFAECKPFCPNFKRAKCVKVHDGDTMELAHIGESGAVRHVSRLLGIITPDIRSKYKSEKILAKIAREELRGMILNKVVPVAIHGTDKYGRLLVRISMEDGGVSESLISRRVAVSSHTSPGSVNWEDMLKERMLRNPASAIVDETETA